MSLTAEELNNVNGLYKQLTHYDGKNADKEKYYEGKNRVSSLGIAIPPQLSQAQNIVGWGGTVVNVIEERLDFRGFIDPNGIGVQDIFRANDLATEASLAHRDALIYGVSYVVVGKGNTAFGEPEILITVESPKKMTGHYNLRTRRLDSALSVTRNNDGVPVSGALYLENETIYLTYQNGWYEVERDVHNLGRVPVARLVNNPRTGEVNGSSEITPAIIGNIKEASRTLLHMAISSEFFSTPQRYILGAAEGAFEDADGNAIDGWTAITGRINMLSRDDNGDMPQVGEFSSNSPEPFIAQTKLYAELCAANAGIPLEYFGVESGGSNPTSADALRVRETRLLKTAERKQSSFAKGWLEAIRIALIIRDGVIPEDFNTTVKVDWKDPAQITMAAAADAVYKEIKAGVLLPDSDVAYNRLGYTDSDKVVLKSEKQVADAKITLANLANAATQATNTPQA